MNFFNKQTLGLIILVSFLFPNFSFASSQCSKQGYTVLTINGIFTDQSGAIKNKRVLEDKLSMGEYNNQPITVDYVYNPTHVLGIDLVDSVFQKYFDQNNVDIQDADFGHMLSDASQKVSTQKLLLVAHSQGNFYANTFYDAVAGQTGGVPNQSIGVYGVASPANYIAGGGLYVTSDTDKVISGAVTKAPKTSILKPNVHINFNNDDDGGVGHDFSKIYLNYEGDRIVSDIKTSLSKLQENNIQDENSPCIIPPKLTWAQKIQGGVVSVVDTSVNAFNNGVTKVENTYLAFIYKTGDFIADIGIGIAHGIGNASAIVSNSGIDPNSLTTSYIPSLTQDSNPAPVAKQDDTPAQKSVDPVVNTPVIEVVDKKETETDTQNSTDNLNATPKEAAKPETIGVTEAVLPTASVVVIEPPITILGGGSGMSAADLVQAQANLNNPTPPDPTPPTPPPPVPPTPPAPDPIVASNPTLLANVHITSDTTWSAVHSPYVITGIVTVDSNSTLTIEHGVVVKFASLHPSQLDVYGTILINGTDTDKVYFTSNKDNTVGSISGADPDVMIPAPGDWEYLEVTDDAVANIQNTVFRYGGGSEHEILNRGNMTLSHVIVTQSASDGLEQHVGSLVVTNSEFSNNQRHGLHIDNGTANVSNSNIFGNGNLGLYDLSTDLLNVANNFWGDASGPHENPDNLDATGNGIYSQNHGPVNFSPWLPSSV